LPMRVRLSDVAAIAERPDVTFVGSRSPRKIMDEKQDIIMTGDLTPGPASIDYLQWLIDRGFSQNKDDYPLVDLTDSTIDEGGTGVTVLNTADQNLRVGGDPAGDVRVDYFVNCSSTPDGQVGAIDGHGSLNAGIIVGYDQRTGAPFQDTDGHNLGLGINPFGRVGSTAIFVPGYDISHCGNTDLGVIKANWQAGGRISSNSWGLTSPPSTYDDGDQAYDVGTRDADPTAGGNQEMIYIFAAANAGPGAATVSSPGAGKNVLTVGASENVRPGWTDGCGVSTSGADNANDVINFSGRGPAPGQRNKPEVIGPGTHIQSGASNYPGYTGTGVCDKYHPTGQTVFAASSGTSHSTPETSGIASLAWWWIEQGGAGAGAGTVDEIGGNRAPSPALMKAWMMAHPTYLTGVSANDNLPSNSQGYGMPNMSIMFDATPKVLLDQSETFDNSGETRTYSWGIADTTKPVRIALAWTDAPGQLGTSPQVNNLDLAVEVNGETYLGNHFTHEYSITGGSPDTKNNYEAVFLPAGTSGDVTITVTATNIAGDGVPATGDSTDQDFAIVCSNCSQAPSFTMSSPSDGAEICAGTEYDATINIGQIQGYDTDVNFAASGNPSGTNASVTPSTVTPPGTTTLEVTSDASVTPGDYTITVTGTSDAITKSLDFALTFFTEPAAAPALDSPADDANSTPLRPTFTWEPAAQASSYLFELATDAAFTDVVISENIDGTSFQPAEDLGVDTLYYWRVTADNTCGANASAVRSFRTAPALGECSTGTTTQVLFADEVPSGDDQWTHDAGSGTDTWQISGSRPASLPFSWKAVDSSSISDQRLTSPVIALPDSLGGLNFQFSQWVLLEGANGTCADGGVLEVAVDGGSFAAIPAGQFLQGAYNGTISSGSGNPLAGADAWCGLGSAYDDVIVDVSPYAGHDAQFRFRLGTNNANPREGWYVDDIKVQGCGTEVVTARLFENGFDP
ncbi:MAG: S8 family serine peptidase, partial [Rhodanobacteraceae bacterium]